MSDDQTPPPPPPATNGATATATAVDVNTPATEEDHRDSTVVPKLKSQIQLLEQDLANANLKIKNLENEISSHESDKRVLTSIASKTSELETQYSTLQQGLISFTSEFEAKERLNVKKISFIEYEKKLLWRKLKEREEEMRKFESENARAIEFVGAKLKEWEVKDRHVLDKLSEQEDKLSKQGDKLSELKDKVSEMEDKISELEAGKRENVDQFLSLERYLIVKEDEISELKAGKRILEDELSGQEAIERERLGRISELEAIEREKSGKISELEARLEVTEREKSVKVSELEAIEREKSDKISQLEATEREKSDKISELEARLEVAEREKRIKLVH